MGQEDPLEEGMATHSNILAWKIPWTEEPGRPQSVQWCVSFKPILLIYACLSFPFGNHKHVLLCLSISVLQISSFVKPEPGGGRAGWLLLLSLKRYNEAGSGMSEELWAGWAAGPQEAQLLWPEALLR